MTRNNKYISLLLICFSLFLFNGIKAQINKVDTINIQYERFRSVQHLNMYSFFLTKKNGQFYLMKESLSIRAVTPDLYSCFDTSSFYCRFYYMDKIIEEGIWNFYFFNNYYRSYYKNGKIKSEGNFYYSMEVGKWIYYKKDGRIFRVILYPSEVNLKERSEIGKVNIKKSIKYYTYPTPQDSINFVKSVKGIWLWRYR